MSFTGLPANAAWHHHGSREGYEAVFFNADDNGFQLDGHTVAAERGQPLVVRYAITLNKRWRTTAAQVWTWSRLGSRTVRLEAPQPGQWLVDGAAAPDLDGCIDIDLESSCCTNTFPVHRLRLEVGGSADTPAAYVRALDLRVQRLEQRYRRVDDANARQRYDYEAPAFDFSARLVYDKSGLLLDYPGIGSRVL